MRSGDESRSEDTECHGADVGVLVFPVSLRIPRSLLAPLPVMSELPDEPECSLDWFWPTVPDTDRDGIDAAHDNCDLAANPGQEDWDGDQDGDACDDSDGDGLTDALEFANNSDPSLEDTDDDGLNDNDEKTQGTDPRSKDTDGDHLEDGDEVTRGTNPRRSGKS